MKTLKKHLQAKRPFSGGVARRGRALEPELEPERSRHRAPDSPRADR